MNTDASRAECGDCGAQLVQARTEAEVALPCPACGSTLRNIFVNVVESAVARDGIGMKAKRVGEKKPFVESLSLPSHSRSLGKLVHHERLIDRDNNLYLEKVTEYETGAVIHEQKEPLSEHVGYGSDKKRHGPN
jgi:DNA-directed RNA polymerase subunit RPC12/RpoP